MIRIALTKGRLEKKAIELFEAIGFDCSDLRNKGRRLILPINNQPYEVILAKAADVLTYIEHGVCDIGIVGKDTIMEYGGTFFEMIDLKFGSCQLSLANKVGEDFYAGYNIKRIASKYPNTAKEYFKQKGMDVQVIKIEGSVELAPLVNLSDGIVDIVETGITLKENGLEVIEEIAEVSARFIVNTISLKIHQKEIEELISKIENYLKIKEEVQ